MSHSASSSPPLLHNRRSGQFWSRWIFFLYLVLGLIVYAPAITGPFLHDEQVFIVQNPNIARLDDIPDLIVRPLIEKARQPIINPYYRPLWEIYHRILYRLLGMRPSGYHFVNILWHASNAFIVFLVFSHIDADRALAAALGLLFLLHPVQTEAVACISGSSNLLSALCVLTGFYIYLRMNHRGVRQSTNPLAQLLLIGAVYAVGLLIKEQTLILPLLVLWHRWCFRDLKGEGLIRPLRSAAAHPVVGVLVLESAVYLIWRKILLGRMTTDLAGNLPELLLRIQSVPVALLGYLRLVFWPVKLHYYRSLDILRPTGPAWALLAILCLLGYFGFHSFRKKQDRPAVSRMLFGLGWFLVTIFPVLNVLPLVHEYSFLAMFEHFLYLPMIGLVFSFLVFSDGILARLGLKNSPRVKWWGLLVVAGVFAAMSLRQARTWRDEVTLFERVVRFEPAMGRVRVLLGKAYYHNGRYHEAIREHEAARAIFLGYLEKNSDGPAAAFYRDLLAGVYDDLGHCWEGSRDFPAAIRNYRQALALQPGNSRVMNNLGTVYLQMGEFPLARPWFEAAISIDPGDLMAKSNLAVCWIKSGERDKARALWQDVLRQDPGFGPARQNLEILLRETGRRE